MKGITTNQLMFILNILVLLVISRTKSLNGHYITYLEDQQNITNLLNQLNASEDYADSKIIFYRIKHIARDNPDGFTVRLPYCDYASTGIVAAYEATQNSFTDEALVKVIRHAATHDNVVGGWLNEDNGRYYYDSCRIFTNRAEAIVFGLENWQKSIYDIDNNEVIWLNYANNNTFI